MSTPLWLLRCRYRAQSLWGIIICSQGEKSGMLKARPDSLNLDGQDLCMTVTCSSTGVGGPLSGRQGTSCCRALDAACTGEKQNTCSCRCSLYTPGTKQSQAVC